MIKNDDNGLAQADGKEKESMLLMLNHNEIKEILKSTFFL